jgi:hypothetical protein
MHRASTSMAGAGAMLVYPTHWSCTKTDAPDEPAMSDARAHKNALPRASAPVRPR